MLERSARQGGHAVCKREMGKTILENQVRIATMLKCEMDTSAHDINRVYFTSSAEPDDLLFLSPELFQDAYDEAAVDEFRDVLFTLQEVEVAGWLRSLQLRGINLPDELKDEAFLIVGERRIH